MQPPMASAFVCKCEEEPTFKSRPLFRVKALIDDDASLFEVDRAKDIRLVRRSARYPEEGVQVVKLQGQAEVLLHNLLDRDRRHHHSFAAL